MTVYVGVPIMRRLTIISVDLIEISTHKQSLRQRLANSNLDKGNGNTLI